MPASRKPAPRKRHGATRRSASGSASGKDRWLNRLLDIAVASALLIGSAALLLSQL